MKKAILSIAVVALVCSTAISKTDPSSTNSSSKLSLSTVKNARFALNMATDSPGKVRLRISDDQGNLILSQKVDFDKSFSLPIDMSSMKQGNYMVKAESAEISLEQEVFISKLHEDDVAAFLTDNGNRNYSLRVFREDVPVSIKVLDDRGNLYYKNTEMSSQNFTQKFDFSTVDTDAKLEIHISGKKTRIVKAI
ncbi:hypothetical protein [Marinoscillum sp.]|uniref:hypothetical protein n=1 Tax=Marinoscillum sp. TaxID=2024838 RepID=UPI003BAAC846